MKKEIQFKGHFNRNIGEVYLSEDGVRFKSSTDEFEWDEFSFHITVSQHMLQITNLTNKKVLEAQADRHVLDFVKKSELSFSSGKVSASGVKEYKKAAVYIGGFILFCFVSLHGVRFYAKNFMKLPPIKEEIQKANQLYNTALKGKLLAENHEATIALRDLAKRLIDKIDTNPFEIKIGIMESSTPNAYAYPGGVIVFTTAFLNKAESPEEILGVLGHEVAHVKYRHSSQMIQAEEYANIFKMVFLGDSSLIGIADTISSLNYSREHESDADTLGLQFLYEANISAKGISEFFERKEGFDFGWMSTHPSNENRINKFQEQIKNEKTEAIEFDLGVFKSI